MIVWVDAQMSPAIAVWISSNFSIEAVAIRDLGLRDARNKEIFQAARLENAVVMTKDSDFVLLLEAGTTTSSNLGDVRQFLQCSAKGNPYQNLAQNHRTSRIWREVG